jgi:O-acetyl-ADP-ribose deacetylase (regulator of RNase III)
MRVIREDRSLEVVRGDITTQDTDAVVNAANKALAPGGGVAGAIHRAAGEELWEECAKIGGIDTGEAVITRGYQLPADYVVHTVGPVYGSDEPAAELLARSYRESLRLADEKGLASIAFPALSTGAFGYPMAEAAEVAFATLLDELPDCAHVRVVRLVLRGERDHQLHTEILERMAPERGWQTATD